MTPRSPSVPQSSSYESHFEHSALFEFSKVINSTLDPQFIFSHILLTIMGKILSTRAMVLLEVSKGKFRIETVKGFSPAVVGTIVAVKNIPSTSFYLERLKGSRYPWAKTFHNMGVRILLPMIMADRPIGLLGFGERFSKKKLRIREQTYLRSLANISATAVEKSRTIQEIQQVNRKLDRRIQELNTLFEIGKEMGALLDPEKIVRLLVFSVLGQIGVNRYLISFREGSDMKVASAKVDGPIPQSEFLLSLAKVKTTTFVSDLIVTQALDPRERLAEMGLIAIIPMQIQEQTKGLLLLGEKLNKEPYAQADFEFLSSLANLAIISLENARLFQEAIEKQKLEDELLIAREIQKGLLPNVLPTLPGIDIAAANISSKQVGGDYYDAIPVAEGNHMIAIGDVSGKGPPAALLMANLQATIRALVPLNISLSDLTCRVNDLMCENTGGSKFVTFFWGVLDHKQRTLTYVNAGHNYPYLIHADGTTDRLDRGGMILGILKTTTPYEEATVSLKPGDILVLFTDGVSEAMNKNSVEYGEARLETVVREHRSSSAQEIIDAIHQDILRHAQGASQSDDITMMVARVDANG